MDVHDAIRTAHGMSTSVIKIYIDDLTDEELCARPHPACHPLAFQLGHLISTSHQLLEAIRPGAAAALPAGFEETHSLQASGGNATGKFCTKQEYLELWDQAEAAAISALEQVSAEDLDQPAPAFLQPMFPTIGHVFLLIANHGLMHAGQFVPVRRALDKPIKI